MNLSYPTRNLVLYLVLFLVPVVLSAQVEYYEVLVNDSLTYNFESVGNAAQIDVDPVHGDYTFNGLLNYPLGIAGLNELVYSPDLNYIGKDTIKILYYTSGPSGPTLSSTTLVIDVVESYVIAVNDYAATLTNTLVNIDVLANDLGPGVLTLTDVPLANYGTAEIVNGTIDFTPEPEFRGKANLTYTVCDDLYDVCDVATITVFVQDDIALNDSTDVATLRNHPVKALFPVDNGIQSILAPKHGEVNLIDGGLEYSPDNDYLGKDTFTYAYNINTTTSLATFAIDILSSPDPNQLTKADHNYTAINDSTEFNVLDNDLNDDLAILTFTQSDKGGQVIHNGDGDFKYIPPTGYSGLDFFEYTAYLPGTSSQEDGIAYIVVSNQLPVQEEYEIFTGKNTPIVLDYDIPISNFDFTIITQGQFGEVIYYPGDSTIQVNGQEVTGTNLLVYNPYNEYTGTDLFEVEYCVEDDCKNLVIIPNIQEITNPQADTLCVTDCVWPGDANRDGIVNMLDVLPLGYCVGEVGNERVNGGNDWYGQFAEDWDGEMGETGINVKHVDTNGDGYISDADTAAIKLSYGETSRITQPVDPVNSQTPLFFVPQTPNAGPGDKVIIDIVLGTENLPAKDVNGITFALNFNQDIVLPGTMTVEYSSDSWLSYESTMMSLMKEPYLGRVESGYTRTTGLSNNGYGIIGQVSFIVVDDIIDGIRTTDTLLRTFRPEVSMSMNAAGEYVNLVSPEFNIRISHNLDEPFDNDNRNLITYPNPTTGNLNIHVNGNNELEQVIVHSLTGQEVYRTNEELSGKQTTIALNERIATGIYLVTAICNKGVYTQKVKLIR